jgi:hypothetical protein
MNDQIITDAGTIIAPLLMLGLILKTHYGIPESSDSTCHAGPRKCRLRVKTGDHTANGIFTAVLVAAAATGIHSGIKNSFREGNASGTPKK